MGVLDPTSRRTGGEGVLLTEHQLLVLMRDVAVDMTLRERERGRKRERERAREKKT